MNSYPKTVLAIHAHPDDTEAYNSGLLKLLKDKGYKIFIATMTAGGLGSANLSQCKAIITRKKEAFKAAEALDAEYYCFDQEDGFVFDNEKIRMDVAEFIRAVNPGIIFTHLPFDYHSDHRTTANIVEVAAMVSTLPNLPTKEPPLEITPLLYHTAPIQLTDQLGDKIADPHFYADITTAMNKKMEMLSCHESQIELMKMMHKMDNFFEKMKEYNVDLGKKCGAEFAEAYWQHLGGGFQKDPLVQEELKDFIILPEGRE